MQIVVSLQHFGTRLPRLSGYNCRLNLITGSSNMEAEHINSISNKLDDLAQRAAELRRYL
ncbi:MAG: hypothetical protein Q8N89_13550 [Azonexus sp.]|nr:hypothetical protein [Azonexus sp.]